MVLVEGEVLVLVVVVVVVVDLFLVVEYYFVLVEFLFVFVRRLIFCGFSIALSHQNRNIHQMFVWHFSFIYKKIESQHCGTP